MKLTYRPALHAHCYELGTDGQLHDRGPAIDRAQRDRELRAWLAAHQARTGQSRAEITRQALVEYAHSRGCWEWADEVGEPESS